MSERMIKSKKKGILFGVISFVILYGPLLAAIIFESKTFVLKWNDLLAQLLLTLIIPVFISVFWGYSIQKNSKLLIILSSILLVIVFIILVIIARIIAAPSI
jgi:hypothetical protein